jgi:cyanophycinase
MATKRKVRTLIAIGGHEDKAGDRTVLKEFVSRLTAASVVVATLASEVSDEMWDEYKRVFRSLGVKKTEHLQLEARANIPDHEERLLEGLQGAGGVFFTGGDQLRITSKLGGTPLCERIQEMYRNGVPIAGTSAGASILTETMVVSGSEGSHRIGDALRLSPGLGFLPAVVIDQHFGERGRIGRLLGIVAQNPRALGLGIDENTAVVIEDEKEFRVIGSGAVYVVDGRSMTHTNVSEEATDLTLSMFDTRLHVLSRGDCYDLQERRPWPARAEVAK